MTRSITVLATGPLTTVQDSGRTGMAALGVGRSGACDRASYRLANRLVGNAAGAAVLEVTLGGLRLRADHEMIVVTTGARCEGSSPHNAPSRLRAGEEMLLGAPAAGLRTYVAVRGGFSVEPVLGSRSTDLLADLGPAVVAVGDVLPVGSPLPRCLASTWPRYPTPRRGRSRCGWCPGPGATGSASKHGPNS